VLAGEISKMVQPIVERRRHERGRVAAIAIVWSEERGPIRYVVEDLSASGALLSGGPDLAVGRWVALALHVAGVHLVDLRAEVIRHATTRGMAVAFRGVPALDEDMIQQAVLGALEAYRRGECPSRYVLVVDDSERVCKSLAGELSALGHHVACAWTLEQAKAKINDPYVRFDIAIVDLSVSWVDGLDLLRQVAATHPGVHRVLMSGRTSHDQLKLAQVMGRADVILPKPWTRRTLLGAMPI
jgi:CheY-like chemotaxis protein